MLTSHTSTLRNSAGATTQLSPHWRNILNVFDQLLATLKQNNVPPFLVSCLLACQQHLPGCLLASCVCLNCIKSVKLSMMLMPRPSWPYGLMTNQDLLIECKSCSSLPSLQKQHPAITSANARQKLLAHMPPPGPHATLQP